MSGRGERTDATPTERSRLFASPHARRRVAVHAFVLCLLFVGAAVLFRRHAAFLTDAEAARAYVRGFGVWAPLVLISLQALQIVLAPIPGQVLGAVGGYLFGPWLGTLYNMIGITIGSTAAFWLSRRFGRSYVERMIDDDALATFDTFVEQRGLLSLFVLFLIPGLPDDILCFLGGLTPIPIRKLVVVAIVGRTPAFFLANVFGDLLATGDIGAALGLLVLVGGLSLFGYLNRKRITRALDGWLQ
ncbi:TVP38/TMEM64 family protein [Haloplanus aerogenes]|uniref:Putative membrane protein YdjX (TVP38/TMEM64 family) n=1 Tax=Haloplanus aerogenes TaxID=660522 RepID=A0A3M0DT89_9EURY|nr:TVP38/TMEM64 family protein [Haloplanus aerogenes]AZH25502.1 TVP38/TMEM64 family protein [Haloplanus aerogenes]RMB25215.1 putative membrane protein YdjX (TVP38/TMEM64 family) [Haloplanus aerogenes]